MAKSETMTISKNVYFYLLLFFLIVSPSLLFAAYDPAFTDPGAGATVTCGGHLYTTSSALYTYGSSWLRSNGQCGVPRFHTSCFIGGGGDLYCITPNYRMLEISSCDDEYQYLLTQCGGEANIQNWNDSSCLGECVPTCQAEWEELSNYCADMPGGQNVRDWDPETCTGNCTCPAAGTYAGEIPPGQFTAYFNGQLGCAKSGCMVDNSFGWPLGIADWDHAQNIFIDLDYTGETCSGGSVDPVPPVDDCVDYMDRCVNFCASLGDTAITHCDSNSRDCSCATFEPPGGPPGSPDPCISGGPDYEKGVLKPCPIDPQNPTDPVPDPDPGPDPEPDPTDDPDDGANGWLKAIKQNTDSIVDINKKISANTNVTANNTARTVDALNTSNSKLNNIQNNTSVTNTKLNTSNSKLSEISGKLDGLDNSGIESRLDTLHGDVDGVEGKLDEIKDIFDDDYTATGDGKPTTPYAPSAEAFNIGSRFDTFLSRMGNTGVFALPNNFLNALPNGGTPIFTYDFGSYGTRSVDLSTMSSALLVLRTISLIAFCFVSIRVLVLKR